MHCKSLIVTLLSAGSLMGLAGCGTVSTGGQFQNTVYDTHRRVSTLDTTVSQLNTTANSLQARVDASEQEMKKLQSISEENQAKLSQIEKKLDTLRDTLYRSMGLSPVPTKGVSEVTVDPSNVTIEQPGATPPAPSVPATPAPGPASSITEPPASTGAPEVIAKATPPAAPPAALPPSTGNPDEDFKQAQSNFRKQDAAGYTAALGGFEAYLQRYPNSDNAGEAQFWKARSLQGLEQYDQAISEFEKFRKAYPNHQKVPYSLHNQAVSHARLGQNDRAIALFEQIIKDYPTNPAAQQAKSDLEKLRGKKPSTP